MPLYKCTAKTKIGYALALPAGAFVEVVTRYTQSQPNPDQIIDAFQQKYGVKVSVCELHNVTKEKIG